RMIRSSASRPSLRSIATMSGRPSRLGGSPKWESGRSRACWRPIATQSWGQAAQRRRGRGVVHPAIVAVRRRSDPGPLPLRAAGCPRHD
ncbi:MAG: hypothetical protein WCH79_17415, partial [Planctomycetia bacterium]